MSFFERIKLKIAISRISKMEEVFDELQLAFSRLNKDFLSDKKLKQKLITQLHLQQQKTLNSQLSTLNSQFLIQQ